MTQFVIMPACSQPKRLPSLHRCELQSHMTTKLQLETPVMRSLEQMYRGCIERKAQSVTPAGGSATQPRECQSLTIVVASTYYVATRIVCEAEHMFVASFLLAERLARCHYHFEEEVSRAPNLVDTPQAQGERGKRSASSGCKLSSTILQTASMTSVVINYYWRVETMAEITNRALTLVGGIGRQLPAHRFCRPSRRRFCIFERL